MDKVTRLCTSRKEVGYNSAMKRPHLNFKNACGWVVGVCVMFFAVIVILIPLGRLAAPPWRWVVLGVAALAIVALTAQMLKQSAEDRDLGRKIDEAISARGIRPDTPVALTPTPAVPEKPAINADNLPESKNGIDGELHRLSLAPRTMSWELLRDVYHAAGRPGEATVDCDVLVEMYLVNRSSQNKFVRDVRLSVEVNHVQTNFAMQRDMRAKDIGQKKYEYGLEVSRDFYAKAAPLKLLLPHIPFALEPEQPTEGWVRFLAKDIDPDKIDRNSWRVIVVDSVGTEYPITKISGRPPEGEVGLRGI
jgi:hypothetical protein